MGNNNLYKKADKVNLVRLVVNKEKKRQKVIKACYQENKY